MTEDQRAVFNQAAESYRVMIALALEHGGKEAVEVIDRDKDKYMRAQVQSCIDFKNIVEEMMS